MHYLDDFLDIEVKKSLRSKNQPQKSLTHVVYPKNLKVPFLTHPSGLQIPEQQVEPQTQQFESFEFQEYDRDDPQKNYFEIVYGRIKDHMSCHYEHQTGEDTEPNKCNFSDNLNRNRFSSIHLSKNIQMQTSKNVKESNQHINQDLNSIPQES